MSLEKEWEKLCWDVVKAVGGNGYSMSNGLQVRAILKQLSDLDTAAFDNAREELERQILDLQKDNATMKMLLAQAAAEAVAGAETLRDRNDPKPEAHYKKQTAALQEAVKHFFAHEKRYTDEISKNLEELASHIIELKKYKIGH